MASSDHVIFFEKLRRADVALVGGKNSSLGEMVQELGAMGITVPPGFATTSDAFRLFIQENNLAEIVQATLADWEAGKLTLAQAGQKIRATIVTGDWPAGNSAASTGRWTF